MLIVDDIIAAPFKGILWTFRKIHQAAIEEIDRQRAALRTDLRDLYAQLDAGQLSESEFDQREKELLDRLDRLDAITKPKPTTPSENERETG